MNKILPFQNCKASTNIIKAIYRFGNLICLTIQKKNGVPPEEAPRHFKGIQSLLGLETEHDCHTPAYRQLFFRPEG